MGCSIIERHVFAGGTVAAPTRFLLYFFNSLKKNLEPQTFKYHKLMSRKKFLFSENPDVTTKSFGFCTKNSIPLYYVSASDGTNVVKTFTDAIEKAVEYKKNPLDIDDQIMEELENFDNSCVYTHTRRRPEYLLLFINNLFILITL